jgi:hypothetical protein
MNKFLIGFMLLTVSFASIAANGTPEARNCPAGVAPLSCRSQCDSAQGTWDGTARTCTAVWANVANPGLYGKIKLKIETKK